MWCSERRSVEETLTALRFYRTFSVKSVHIVLKVDQNRSALPLSECLDILIRRSERLMATFQQFQNFAGRFSSNGLISFGFYGLIVHKLAQRLINDKQSPSRLQISERNQLICRLVDHNQRIAIGLRTTHLDKRAGHLMPIRRGS